MRTTRAHSFSAGTAVIAALVRDADLIGRPVVDASTGDDLGEIRDVIFNPALGEITGFTLRKRGFPGRRLKDVLRVDAVVSVGTDAVMVEGAEALTAPQDAPVTMEADSANDVLGDEV